MTEGSIREDDKALAVLGGIVAHAEALQAQAATMLDHVGQESAANQATIARLLTGMAEISQAFGDRHQQLEEQIAALTKATGQIGAQAYKGGAAAVAHEARAALKGAGPTLAAVAQDASAPVSAAILANAAVMEEARQSFEAARQRLSWKNFVMLAGLTVGSILVIAGGSYSFVLWQRAAVEAARDELASFEQKNARLRPVIADMEARGAELDAKGVRFITDQCPGATPKAKTRLCVAIDPAAAEYSSEDGRQKFRVPLGF